MYPIYISRKINKISKTMSLAFFIFAFIITSIALFLFIGVILSRDLDVFSFIIGLFVVYFTIIIINLILELRLDFKVKNVCYDEKGNIFIDETVFSVSKVDYIKKSDKLSHLYIISINKVCYYFYVNSNYERSEKMKFYSNFDFSLLSKFNKKFYIHKSVELFANQFNIIIIPK